MIKSNTIQFYEVEKLNKILTIESDYKDKVNVLFEKKLKAIAIVEKKHNVKVKNHNFQIKRNERIAKKEASRKNTKRKILNQDVIVKGFYYVTGEFERCYYISGEKKGNMWIDIGEEGKRFKNPEWWTLNWMCLSSLFKNEMDNATYYISNPTEYKLN